MSEKIQRLNGYSYKFRADEFKEKNFDNRSHIGFIAQELKEVFPDLVKEDTKGYYAVDYQGMIPVLLEVVKEQGQKINNLENQLAASQKQNSTTSAEELNFANGFYMEQNKPNPFDQNTVINYSLPTSVNVAYLMVCDYSGKKFFTYSLTATTGSVTIEAKDLPGEGIYLYSIVSNGEVLGTKKMVVSNK